MATFGRGFSATEELAGVRPINAPPTAVIGLVGTAPNFLGSGKGEGNLALVASDKNAAAFGPDLPGYTIPNALNAIMDYGTARVIVVDVFDPEIHKTEVDSETVAIDAQGNGRLANMGIISAELTTYNGVPLIEGTDYKLDKAYGAIKRVKGGGLPLNAEIKASYEYGDPSKVTSLDIIGTTDGAGIRSGLQSFLDAGATLGYKPRILITPGYAAGTGVASAAESLAEKLKAHYYVDVPFGATIQQVIEARGNSGAISLPTESARTVLCYPRVGVMDTRTDSVVYEPLSQNLAGLACYVDSRKGIAESPSNLALNRVVGLETPIQWDLNDQNCEANMLNAVGIVTVVRPFGGAFRSWGNRSAAWPSETHPVNFINVRAVGDYLIGMVERAAAQYVDRLLVPAVLNALKEDVIAEFEVQVRKNVIIKYEFNWLAEDNPVSELAMGHAHYELRFMSPVPMEWVVLRSVIDSNWLKEIYRGA
jgi:phage tail sheath protein FI